MRFHVPSTTKGKKGKIKKGASGNQSLRICILTHKLFLPLDHDDDAGDVHILYILDERHLRMFTADI